MARAIHSNSAFVGLREAQREMAIQARRISRLAPLAIHDFELLSATIESACALDEMLTQTAAAEERLVFPCLLRWLKHSAGCVRKVRDQRGRLGKALQAMLLASRRLLCDRGAASARRFRTCSLLVAAEFRDWARIQEHELFALGDGKLGAFAATVLAGRIELSLSAARRQPSSSSY